jgi:hypothetical protein
MLVVLFLSLLVLLLLAWTLAPRRRRYDAAVSLLAVAVICAAACTTINLPTPPESGDVNVLVTQNQDSFNSGGATPRPVPGAELTGGIYKVKVGFFGGDCPSGPLTPGQTELTVNCNGNMTATPKVKLSADSQLDRDATEAEHGPGDGVAWTSEGALGVLVCVTSPANGFNRICAAKAKGHYKECATVRTVKGCAEGNVQ